MEDWGLSFSKWRSGSTVWTRRPHILQLVGRWRKSEPQKFSYQSLHRHSLSSRQQQGENCKRIFRGKPIQIKDSSNVTVVWFWAQILILNEWLVAFEKIAYYCKKEKTFLNKTCSQSVKHCPMDFIILVHCKTILLLIFDISENDFNESLQCI